MIKVAFRKAALVIGLLQREADRVVKMPVIDLEKCNGCGLCISVCKCGVIVLVNNIVTIIRKGRYIHCNRWCAHCEDVCPTAAISYPFEIVIE